MWTDAANEIAWALARLLSRGQQRERRQQGQTLRYSIKIKRSGLTDKAHDAEKGLRFNERKYGAHLNSVCVSPALRASLSARSCSVATGSEGKWQTTPTERTQRGNRSTPDHTEGKETGRACIVEVEKQQKPGRRDSRRWTPASSACVDWRQGNPDVARFWILIGRSGRGKADAEKVRQENDIYTVYQF